MTKRLIIKDGKWLPLAPLAPGDVARAACWAVLMGMAFLLFHLQGNTTDIRMFGRSALLWMTARWSDAGGEYSHGWLIPLVSLWLVCRKRRELRAVPKAVDWRGLAVVVLALFLHWLGARAQQTRLSLLGLILLLWGAPFYVYGRDVARLTLFPCVYLVFCIPMNFVDSMTSPLRTTAAMVATSLLNGLGIPVYRIGSGLFSESTAGFSFDVAPECSGLHSLLALTALTAVYAYLTQDRLWKKWFLFACSVPIALVGNIVRITLVVLVAAFFGQETAMGLWHDYSGYPIFLVGITLMLSVGGLLELNYRKVWNEWKESLLRPTSSSSPS